MSRVLRTEIRRLVVLGAPSMVAQLAMMLQGVVDVFMLGRVGKIALAGATLGHVWIYGTMVFGMGLVFGMDPIVTQAFGRRDREALALCLQRALFFTLIICVPLGALWLLAEPVLARLSGDAFLSHVGQEYITAQIVGLPAFLLFTAIRQYLQGKGIVRPVMWIAILSNVVNVVFNVVLIFGHLGFPALGVVGAGIATALTRVVMLVAVIALVVLARLDEPGHDRVRAAAFDGRGFRELLRYGLPVGIQFGLEVWAFQVATLMAGRLGTEQLAAHTIVLNLAALAFMMPMGISLGVVTRVGNLIGEGRYHRAQLASWVAFGMGAGVMCLSATVFVVFGRELAGAFTGDAAVIEFAAMVFPIAAGFQFFDGTQVVGGGVLRGMGRTRPAAVFNLLAYYAFALPIGWFLTFPGGLGLRGVWWGCLIGLGAVAFLCLWWVATRGPASLRPRRVDRSAGGVSGPKASVSDLAPPSSRDTGAPTIEAARGGFDRTRR